MISQSGGEPAVRTRVRTREGEMVPRTAVGEEFISEKAYKVDAQRPVSNSGCVAAARHEREEAEVKVLVRMPDGESSGTDSYKVTAEGPARVTTRIKGIKAGFEIAPGKTTGTITTRAQGASNARTTIRDAYPCGYSSGSETPMEEAFRAGKMELIPGAKAGKALGKRPGTSEASATGDVDQLRDQLAAREALCTEQQLAIDILRMERDDLKDKLDRCLEELENVKKLKGVGDVAMPLSCQEEISALEMEIKLMRSGNLSPEQEAEIIKKEVQVLRKYCLKLKSIEDENEKLKLERDDLKSQVAIGSASSDENLKFKMEQYGSKEKLIEELNYKVKDLEETTKERDALASRVKKLEKELLQYQDLPDDIDVYRDRSKMLDSALEERDKMNVKVEQMKDLENELNYLRKKAARVDELEQELKFYSKNDTNANIELRKTKSRCSCLERELQNVKMERDTMGKRIEHMKREMDILRSKSKEAEMLKLERDRLQIKLNELSHVQVQQENLLLKCKCLENAAKERDTYKQKYDEILSMECQCEMLRSQVDAARDLARERDGLVKQVKDLEACICEQECEIKNLVTQIDGMSRNKDEKQCRMKDALANMRAEVEKKDHLIAASEEKLAAVQSQLKSSIQGVSCETTCYRTRIEDLERELNQSQSQIKTLQKQLRDSHTSLKTTKQLTKNECDSVAAMRRELEAAQVENKKLQDIANKMASLTGDEHVQKMLKQSECAVKRVVEELSRQYKEWDQFKSSQKKDKGKCGCKCYQTETSGSESSEKLRDEIEDIQREKGKLERLIRELQNDKTMSGSQKELISLKLENSNLQEQLQKEIKQRRDLEKMLK
ncbi:hypothetical protein NQ318_011099 [Aromia moschata]|uniref:Uncharacterized protein n=1 Tax=Aromia moschata TaxID=1265417 RepID=A0AAV8YU59_9CUCU|nr:hypothetical protein NQ318_011099 [Aromia moschata]